MPHIEPMLSSGREISVGELAELLAPSNRKNRPLVLDCRPHVEFARSHLTGAVNVVLPSLLLKRLSRGAVTAVNAIPALKDSQGRQVVAYDGGTNGSPSHVLSVILTRLSEEGTAVRVLEGGFRQFIAEHHKLCRGQEETGGNSEDSDTEVASHGLHVLSLAVSDASSGSSDSEPLSTPFSGNNGKGNNSPPSEVLPWLYLGTAAHASDRATLERLGITCVLNVTPDLPNVFADDSRIEYLRVPIADHWSQDLAAHFPRAIAFIDRARSSRQGVLVHCLAGISRSVTVTVAYLMKTKSMTLEEAFDFVRERKPNVSPNFTFLQQLLQFEHLLRPEIPDSPPSTSSSPLAVCLPTTQATQAIVEGTS